jgi:mitochondrial fission protein ELM1
MFLHVWLLGDGKPGHENQSLGLAEALGRQTRCEIHRISLTGCRALIGRLKSACAASADLPRPDLIIAAGHATHPSLLWLARKHRARGVVLMRPSLPLSWFDLCIAPTHDFPNTPTRQNLILTRGALNRVPPPDSRQKSGKLILIGGPSKTHGWDSAALLKMLASATDRGGWELTDSRRTPFGFLDQARDQLPGVTFHSHRETPPDWLPEKLRQAKEVWVTEDSVSMIYEALTSGARVGLLPVPRFKMSSRVISGLEKLANEGFLTPYAAWSQSMKLAAPPEILREADRCALEIISKKLL